MEIILIIFLLSAAGLFILSKFKKFANLKFTIVKSIQEWGYPPKIALRIYDENHYEIAKMVSAGYSEREIAERYVKEEVGPKSKGYSFIYKQIEKNNFKKNQFKSEDEIIKIIIKISKFGNETGFLRTSNELITSTVINNKDTQDFYDSDFWAGYFNGLTTEYFSFHGLDLWDDMSVMIVTVSLAHLLGSEKTNSFIDKIDVLRAHPTAAFTAGLKSGKTEMNEALSGGVTPMDFSSYLNPLSSH